MQANRLVGTIIINGVMLINHTCMNHFVRFQPLSLCKCFPTHFTFEWSFSSVYQLKSDAIFRRNTKNKIQKMFQKCNLKILNIFLTKCLLSEVRPLNHFPQLGHKQVFLSTDPLVLRCSAGKDVRTEVGISLASIFKIASSSSSLSSFIFLTMTSIAFFNP